MHLVDMHTMINEKAAVEEHDTDKGFYKQTSEVQHTLRKMFTFFPRINNCRIMVYTYDLLFFLSMVLNLI